MRFKPGLSEFEKLGTTKINEYFKNWGKEKNSVYFEIQLKDESVILIENNYFFIRGEGKEKRLSNKRSLINYLFNHKNEYLDFDILEGIKNQVEKMVELKNENK